MCMCVRAGLCLLNPIKIPTKLASSLVRCPWNLGSSPCKISARLFLFPVSYPQCSMYARVHLVARLDIFATREPNIVEWLPAIYSARSCDVAGRQASERASEPSRPARAVSRLWHVRLTFVQLLSQLEGLLISRAAVVNFIQVQRRVRERQALEHASASLHQNRRLVSGDVELRAQRETEHCKV